MTSIHTRACAIAVAVLSLPLFSPAANAEQFFATEVINTVVGQSQDPAFNDPALALGGPVGGGSAAGGLDVYNLGIGGSLTLGFDSGVSPHVVRDQPGPDFIVFENAFYTGSSPPRSYAELVYVEVSSNGVDFARFPVTSNTPQLVPPFSTIKPTDVSGFAGVHPVLANVQGGSISPFDPTVAGGDAFDLADLASHPLVVSGKVDLGSIRQIRLVDVVGDGRDRDRNNNPIYDPTGLGSNGADIDAIAVISGAVLVVSAKLTGAGGGSFNDASRWDGGLVPNGARVSADISALGNGATLTVDQSVRLGHLSLGSNGNTLAGPQWLTLGGGGAAAGIFGVGGVHTISAAVEFSGDVVLSAGGGTIILTGPLTYDSDTAITVVDGIVEFAVQQGPVHVGDNVSISIMGGSTLSLAGSIDPLSDSSTGQAMAMSFAPVPEPGSLAYLSLAGCMLLRRRR